MAANPRSALGLRPKCRMMPGYAFDINDVIAFCERRLSAMSLLRRGARTSALLPLLAPQSRPSRRSAGVALDSCPQKRLARITRIGLVGKCKLWKCARAGNRAGLFYALRRVRSSAEASCSRSDSAGPSCADLSLLFPLYLSSGRGAAPTAGVQSTHRLPVFFLYFTDRLGLHPSSEARNWRLVAVRSAPLV
jgi:hypothetical protein